MSQMIHEACRYDSDTWDTALVFQKFLRQFLLLLLRRHHNMAEKIIEIFEDEKRLENFQERSYEIASRFKVREVEDSWRKFVQEVLHQEKRTSEPFMLGNTFNNFMCSYRKASGNLSHRRWKKRKR